jgi:hypothetical protein
MPIEKRPIAAVLILNSMERPVEGLGFCVPASLSVADGEIVIGTLPKLENNWLSLKVHMVCSATIVILIETDKM